MTLQQQFSPTTSDLQTGLDFIITHFDSTILYFPRTIMTKKLSYQKEVYSKQEVLQYFQQSNFVDCRINAFRYSNSSEKWNPDLIFIDLDKNNFQNNLVFENGLINTLKNIKTKLGDKAIPTVLNSGGGYHIILPIKCPIPLENITEFQEFDRPSKQFLRFSKDYLSNGKADKNNNPSFKSCLLRIPGSINSKYNKKVKIVQKWNGVRPSLPIEFMEEFRTCLIQKKIDEANRQRQKKVLSMRNKNRHVSNLKCINYYYEWIDKKILANPFPDCRKIIVDLILAPYLINIKKLSYQESYRIIKEWLDKCNSLKKLDNYQNFINCRINLALKTATQKGIGPMSLYKIKTEDRYNTNLYLLVLQNEKV